MIDGAVGFVAGQAWPQPEAGVSPVVATGFIAIALGFTALVLHVRKGRP